MNEFINTKRETNHLSFQMYIHLIRKIKKKKRNEISSNCSLNNSDFINKLN